MYPGERGAGGEKESERAEKEPFGFKKKTQPADSLASILLSARWIIDKSANTLKQRGGNTRCMSIMPLNRPSTRTKNSIYEKSTASDFAPCFFSIMDTSSDEISQYFNLFALLRIQSFFYLHLPLRKSSFRGLFLFVV